LQQSTRPDIDSQLLLGSTTDSLSNAKSVKITDLQTHYISNFSTKIVLLRHSIAL